MLSIYTFLANRSTHVKRVLRSWFIRFSFKYCHSTVWFDSIDQLVGAKNISIKESTNFQKGLFLTAWDCIHGVTYSPTIEIGKNCSFGAYNHITCTNRITIGNGVLTGKWVTITDNSHGTSEIESLEQQPSLRQVVSRGPVTIGENVWIGDKVTILPGVTIGDGSIVGANSVVSKDIPPYCICGGCPAKVIKKIK